MTALLVRFYLFTFFFLFLRLGFFLLILSLIIFEFRTPREPKLVAGLVEQQAGKQTDFLWNTFDITID